MPVNVLTHELFDKALNDFRANPVIKQIKECKPAPDDNAAGAPKQHDNTDEDFLAALRKYLFKYVGTPVAADITGLAARTLEDLRYRGGGPPYYRLGPRKVVYNVGELLVWMQSKRRLSTSDPGPLAA